jgi:sugar lactone lactonase YvrE
MNNADQRRALPHLGISSCIAVMAAMVAMSGGCNSETPGSGTGGNAGSGGSNTGGTAGSGGSSATSMNEAARLANPFDATPDPEGKVVYIAALDAELGAGVFKVPAGGGAKTTLYAGAPFVSPVSIATSTDGANLYVADPGWESDDETQGGQIFSLSAGGGSPSAVPGTGGTLPRGLEVFDEKGKDFVIFSGRAPDGTANVFKVAATGGASTALTTPGALADPSGVAVTSTGDVYVADTRSSGRRDATIVLVKEGATSEVLSDVPVGYPVGIALSKDETTLMVSGLDRTTSTDIVYVVNLASRDVSTFSGATNVSITQFEEPAGLHRAKKANVFAWADSRANAGGTVYTITQ